MINLLLCILFSSSLIIIFKLFHRYKVPVAQAIFINYVTCTLLGLLVLNSGFSQIKDSGLTEPWVLLAMVAGALFFVTFYLIAKSTREAGITATSVAQKVSLVIPVAASLLLWQTHNALGVLNIAGLLLAVAAVVLSAWQKKQDPEQVIKQQHASFKAFLLPGMVFLNAGLADTLINYANFRFLSPELQAGFTTMVFVTAAVLGFFAQVYSLLIRKNTFKLKSIPAGILLGIPNLLTLFFLLRALSSFDNNGAFVYPVNNIGVIVVSVLVGVLIFKEQLRRVNWFGLGLAVASLGLLFWAE